MKSRNNLFTKTTTGALAALAGVVLASCGGGGGSISPGPGPGGNPKPSADTADLRGQLVEGAGGRVASTVGSALDGVPVTLINALSGALQGTQLTNSLGGFEFKAIPSGGSYLIKVEFTAAQDLDGDGANDQVELYFPLSVADQSINQLVQTISLDDSNNDGSADALVVESALGDDKGAQRNGRRQHRFRDGRTIEDSNGNGSFSDDSGFDDSNCDNLPDSSGESNGNSSGGSAGVAGIELFGVIESIGAGTLSVAGVEFGYTSATEWQIGDNHHADPSEFAAGTQVKVEGFIAADGSRVATEVKTGASSVDDDPGSASHVETFGEIEALAADSVTIGGLTYALDGATEWKLNGEHVSAAEFAAGMQVKIEAVAEAGGYRALEIKSGDNGGSDDSIDDNGGSDDSVDDNGGSDDSVDDNGGSDDSGDDNSGSDDNN